jgi:hypothetical protein
MNYIYDPKAAREHRECKKQQLAFGTINLILKNIEERYGKIFKENQVK